MPLPPAHGHSLTSRTPTRSSRSRTPRHTAACAPSPIASCSSGVSMTPRFTSAINPMRVPRPPFSTPSSRRGSTPWARAGFPESRATCSPTQEPMTTASGGWCSRRSAGGTAPRDKQPLTARVQADLPRDLAAGLARLRRLRRRPVRIRRSGRGVGSRGARLSCGATSHTAVAGPDLHPAAAIYRQYQRRGRYERPVGSSTRDATKGDHQSGRQRRWRVPGRRGRRTNGRGRRLSRVHGRARSGRQRRDAGQPRRARAAAPQARRRAERHAVDGCTPGQAAAARADGASGARVAVRPRRRAARRLAPGADDCQPRRHPSVQGRDRVTVSQHRGHAADRSLRLDARAADADRRADRRDLRPRAGALQREVRGPRLHDARMGRRRAGTRVGGGRLSGASRAGSTPWSTSSSRAPTCRGGAPAPASGSSCATRS